jgi:hypothetical protein
MQIAKIISSHSHTKYFARVLDTLEVAIPPRPADYAFGRFVRVESDERSVIGVISNSQLINPEYGNFGPRLSSPPEANRLFSPDYLHDQGVLIEILMLGRLENDYGIHQIPDVVLPVHAPVVLPDEVAISAFHRNKNGELRLGYYSHVMSAGGTMAAALMITIINQLEKQTGDSDQARLNLLRRNLAWQQTLSSLNQR